MGKGSQGARDDRARLVIPVRLQHSKEALQNLSHSCNKHCTSLPQSLTFQTLDVRLKEELLQPELMLQSFQTRLTNEIRLSQTAQRCGGFIHDRYLLRKHARFCIPALKTFIPDSCEIGFCCMHLRSAQDLHLDYNGFLTCLRRLIAVKLPSRAKTPKVRTHLHLKLRASSAKQPQTDAAHRMMRMHCDNLSSGPTTLTEPALNEKCRGWTLSSTCHMCRVLKLRCSASGPVETPRRRDGMRQCFPSHCQARFCACGSWTVLCWSKHLYIR